MRHSNYFIVDVGRSIQGRDRKTIRKPSIERIRAIDPELIAQQALTEPIEENNPYRQFVPSVDLTDNDNYRRRYNLNDVIQPNVNYPIYKDYSIGSDDILKKANDNYDAALANTIAVTNNNPVIENNVFDSAQVSHNNNNNINDTTLNDIITAINDKSINVTYKPKTVLNPNTIFKHQIRNESQDYLKLKDLAPFITLAVPFHLRKGLYEELKK